jgi:hypothetical protein
VISELRRYRIKPERLDSWVRFFAEAAVENERCGIRVEYAGVDRETSTFVWIRSFEDEPDRVSRKDAFYGGTWWLEREAFAMDHVIEYECEFLEAAVIRPDGLSAAAPAAGAGEPAGSRSDSPPDGWIASSRQRFVRDVSR